MVYILVAHALLSIVVWSREGHSFRLVGLRMRSTATAAIGVVVAANVVFRYRHLWRH